MGQREAAAKLLGTRAAFPSRYSEMAISISFVDVINRLLLPLQDVLKVITLSDVDGSTEQRTEQVC